MRGNQFQSDDAPDLAILDWVMPGMTGPEVCRMVRNQQRDKYTYLILLTSKSLKEDLIEGMESGADDYVTKPFGSNTSCRFGCALESAFSSCRPNWWRLVEELRDQATKDPLTKLWNRRYILEVLDRELARIQRHDTSLGLIMLDLDHFKSINDTYGHMAGDEGLAGDCTPAADRYGPAVRRHPDVMAARSSCSLCRVAAALISKIQAERLRLSLCQTPMKIGDVELTVTGSFGATFALPAYRANQDDLVKGRRRSPVSRQTLRA